MNKERGNDKLKYLFSAGAALAIGLTGCRTTEPQQSSYKMTKPTKDYLVIEGENFAAIQSALSIINSRSNCNNKLTLGRYDKHYAPRAYETLVYYDPFNCLNLPINPSH